jgi:hypothetical protein
MDIINLRSVQLGGLRIGGLLGHALAGARRLASSRKLWKFVGFAALAGGFGSLGVVAGMNYLSRRHAQALMSPIEKKTYTVEDAHGAGRYMVVRNGTTHLKLKCAGGEFKDEKGERQTFGDSGCYEFRAGEQVVLEKWDQGFSPTYVYKMKEHEREFNYDDFSGEDL